MTRDQKPRLQTKTPKSASRGSTLVGIFVGLILGALVAAGIALYFTSSSPFPKAKPDNKPERLRVSRKESRHMSIEFFKLPAALKKAIWAAYLAEWKKKQAAKKPATH